MSGRFSVQGSLLADRYKLDEVLGKGSMGAVYRAMDEKLRQPCAIKLLHHLVNEQDEQYGRFATEAAAITQLFHPNIVQVREFSKDRSGGPFLVMEFLRGRDLYSLLQDRPRLSLLQTLDILRQVGSALHCAHSQGIVHRDIKPKNVFLSRQTNAYGDDFEVVKVVDFGLSKFIGRKARNETGLGTILGTLEYLSPEATLGVPSAVDYRADQWALGVMAYRMLSGRLPFDHDDPVQLLVSVRERPPIPLKRLVPELPEHIDAAIRRALAKKKEDRFATVQDFVRALDGLPSAHCAMQPAAPSLGVPTLMLPHVAMPGTVLSVPEPVIFEASKRLRSAVAVLPASAVPLSPSRSDGVPKVEAASEPTRPRAISTQYTRAAARTIRPWRVAAALALGLGLSVFGSLSAQRLLLSPRPVQTAPASVADREIPVSGTLPIAVAAPSAAAKPEAPEDAALQTGSSKPSSPAKAVTPSANHGSAPAKRGKAAAHPLRSASGPSEARLLVNEPASALSATIAPALPLTAAAIDSVRIPTDTQPAYQPRISMVD